MFFSKQFQAALIIVLLILSVGLMLTVQPASVSAESVDATWYYGGWQYRKSHLISTAATSTTYNFYGLSNYWTTISGNPTQRHTFQPVHSSTILQVNKQVDGNVWKYLAYDSNPEGSQIRLYYSNDTAGTWTPYSGNPILGAQANNYRWPSVTYSSGSFHMFLEDRASGTLERWTSTNGITFTFVENVKTGGNEYKNPFIWYNPNNARWYLYSHDASGTTESIKVRSATSLTGLRTATDSTILSRDMPFGSPTVMYYNGYYWLLAEIYSNSQWQVVAYYSTSPTSGFVEAANSPILTDDEACPMLFLLNSTRAFLYTTANSASWYVRTMEVNLNSPIVPQAADLTDYQTRIVVNYGTGTSSGDTVYLNGHCQPSFNDVRFTWLNPTTSTEVECPFWIEQSTTGSSAIFWVKVPQIKSTGSTMYVYYGKSDAATISNGAATFDFFDDFSGDLSKWTTVGGSWQIQSGELVAQTTAFGQRLRANGFTFANHSIHVSVKWISGTYFEAGPMVRGTVGSEQNNGYMTFLSTWSLDNRERISMMSGGLETVLASQGTTNPSTNVWYNYVFKLFGNQLRSTITPLYSTELSAANNAFSSGSLCLFSWSGASETVRYDNVFVTKYSYPEPNQTSWGSEETGSIPPVVNIDNSFVSDARADVGTAQTVGFHCLWNNGSAITSGSLYLNGTQTAVNGTGWANLAVSSSSVTRTSYVVTAVNVGGVTQFTSTISPSIIWDRIKIIDGGLTNTSVSLGDRSTVWFKAAYEYDSSTFNNANGVLQVNASAMTWSSANSRWEYSYLASAPGTVALKVSSVTDNQFGLTKINDVVGAQFLMVNYQPFYVTTNSSLSDLAFNSTSKAIYFTVSGPTGTTGYVNLTISKTLVPSLATMKVYVDGNQISYSSTGNDYYWFVQFTYHHSTHDIAVLIETQEPIITPTPTPTSAPTPSPTLAPTESPTPTGSPTNPPPSPTPTENPNPQPSTTPTPTANPTITETSTTTQQQNTQPEPTQNPQPTPTNPTPTSPTPPMPLTPTLKPENTSAPTQHSGDKFQVYLAAFIVVASVLLLSVLTVFRIRVQRRKNTQ
ncbi:MAG: DUF2341 domain-containing protein [Candidatus Bathyarchaeota archaeon]|nr:DUF2341 domain-containing protein [Candidatus Bathyarchaeota archaeon]